MRASNRVYIPLQDGVYIRSIFLEGAGWDKRIGVLVEPAPMQLVCHMPVIYFRPTEQLKKRTKGNEKRLNESKLRLTGKCYFFTQDSTIALATIIPREAEVKDERPSWLQSI